MMNKNKLTRRNLILNTPAFLAGFLLFGEGLLRPAAAAEPGRTTRRPPGTCNSWVNKKGDGNCDQSENGSCRKQNCPAHKDNPKRKPDAPKGTCALWKDPDHQGFCETSVREERPCPCITCPANRNHEKG
jgi:hypothetical protein